MNNSTNNHQASKLANMKNSDTNNTIPAGMPPADVVFAEIAAAAPPPVVPTIMTTLPFVRMKNGWMQLSLGNFAKKLNLINGKMNNNPYFPTLQPQVDDLMRDEVEYNRLAVLADKGGKMAILDRDALRVKISDKLTQLGSDVVAASRGDLRALTSSGFEFTDSRTLSPDLVTPLTPTMAQGTSRNSLAAKGKKQKGSKGATWYITETPDVEESWRAEPSTRVKHVFTGLKYETKYYVKYSLTGPRNQVVMSAKASFVTQSEE